MPHEFAHEAIAFVLGAGIPVLTDWGPLLAILLLFVIQTALAYRRGKVEPLPPGRGRDRRAPARIPEPLTGQPGRQTSERGGQETSGGALSVGGGDSAPERETVLFLQGEVSGPAMPAVSPGSLRPSAALLRRLQEPIGAREAFLGAEILWNPPVALREPGKAGV